MLRMIGLVCVAMVSVSHAGGNGSVLTVKAPTFDFGTVTADEPHVHDFTFVNTGKQPLSVSSANSNCGCVVVEWTKAPLAPGQTGTIKSTINTHAIVGRFSKSITLSSTAGSPFVLTLKGDVIATAKR